MSQFEDQAYSVALNGAALLIMDHQLWYDTKMFVSDLVDDTSLTKEQKHEKVKQDLLFIFKDVAKSLVDIAIKLAVLWFQSQGVQFNHAPSEA